LKIPFCFELADERNRRGETAS